MATTDFVIDHCNNTSKAALLLFAVICFSSAVQFSNTADIMSSSAVTVSKVAPAAELGEGPHWDVKSQTLYYVDINGRKILRYDPSDGKVTYARLKNGHVGVAVPVEGTDDKIVAACGTDIVLVTWDGRSNVDDPPVEKLASLDDDRIGTRINDGKCDASGRLWLGTMAVENSKGIIEPNRGTLYKMGVDLKPKSVISPVTISNGLAWSLDNDVMYYIDSPTLQVWAFDYDPTSGSMGNKRVAFDLKENDVKGIPDGMTIDSGGNLWVALFDGAAVVQVDPRTGELLQKINLSSDKITSVAFGGPDLDVLYVTSAYINMNATERSEKPDAGSLYAIRNSGARGCPPNNFKYNSS